MIRIDERTVELTPLEREAADTYEDHLSNGSDIHQAVRFTRMVYDGVIPSDDFWTWLEFGAHGQVRNPNLVHLHTPTSGPVCGAPIPADRQRGMTAYRSDITCAACKATLR